MSGTEAGLQITFRIPGAWAHPGELVQRLPAGHRLTPEGLVLPDQTVIECFPMPPDGQFASIFRSSCRRPATEEEQAIVSKYTVNIGLIGPGGSMQAAHLMMQAAAAIVRAGAAGVFIDNSVTAHGGTDWLAMTDDGSTDAISFAFTMLIEGPREVATMGLQSLGFPNLVMSRTDVERYGGDSLIEIVRYVCREVKPIDVGHVFVLDEKRQFRAVTREKEDYEADSPMHNPQGRLRLASIASVAEGN